jgi:hypothetical protein
LPANEIVPELRIVLPARGAAGKVARLLRKESIPFSERPVVAFESESTR